MKSAEGTSGEAYQLFNKGLSQLGLHLSEDQVHSLVLYCAELQKWNRKVNLVARKTSLLDLIDKHFLDSLTLVPVLKKYKCRSGSMLDVGSGAGFPGLVTKIACPALVTVLLEPRHKRVSFLKNVIRKTGLEKIEVLMNRTDDDHVLSQYTFDVITGRAVADVENFLNMVQHLASPESLVVCMQGDGGKVEWEAKKSHTSFQCVGIDETKLPFSGANRNLLLFRRQ